MFNKHIHPSYGYNKLIIGQERNNKVDNTNGP